VKFLEEDCQIAELADGPLVDLWKAASRQWIVTRHHCLVFKVRPGDATDKNTLSA